jgi:hypothetical protein
MLMVAAGWPSRAEGRSEGVSRPPLWRQMYDRIERAVAPRLEAGVRTGMFASALAAVTKARAELNRRESQLAGRLGAVSACGLHLVNLPAADDITRLRVEIRDLDRRMRGLTRQLDQAEWEGQADGRDGKSGGGAGAGLE